MSEAQHEVDVEAGVPDAEPDLDAPRPQAILLTFLGGYLLGRGVHVATSSLVDVLGRAGVSEHATRSTVSRMARRDQIHRVRRGRQVYVGPTPVTREVLRDGDARIWRTDVVNTHWDGSWTLLSFSLPEAWARERHLLRARLSWAGFGPLQGGLWIAPGDVDVRALAEGLGLDGRLRAFGARALDGTDVDALVRDAWDLPALAARYQAFRARWGDPATRPHLPDPLAAQLVLQTDWLQAIRRDPRLPRRHLPLDWPAEPAHALFRDLYTTFEPGARAGAAALDVIPDEEATDRPM
ncbi:PaaX family transcriptional regulator C-terminal domain-containing protein [Actinomycetospora straminea]|uniref:PaaX family transcriptional regulator C-terminal domain-containing protein n=1 Tax=Actinomycetospora straminea TaxID=663607 RepID=A0ABP9DVV7_9PSEU|nr:PaaX family transcriptional regulator C-terminal domain-containing protein [Actinomycetospora straminea]MDD7932518.1 PaaX family transcriptional regulator C-terminal domain-containing protein [Actinomycetospora straminea]